MFPCGRLTLCRPCLRYLAGPLRGTRPTNAGWGRLRTHFKSARNDLFEQGPRFAAFGRPVRLPDVWMTLRQDVREVATAFHAERRKFRYVHVARPVIAVLDEQPGPIGAARRPT